MAIGYFGHYELIQELGRGDRAIVYEARNLGQNQRVALKMLQSGAQATEENWRQLRNEARVVAWLDHPHIVPIFAFGQIAEVVFIEMERIEGPSLNRKLGAFTADLRASARLVRTLAETVHYAHQHGILHLDLNPHNVVIDEAGEPHLIDFGLAQHVQADRDLIERGAILGTSAYMAPEQVSGERGMLTTATDIHGLGAILYALIAGRAPFGARARVEAFPHVRERTPEPPSRRHPWISRDLEAIVLKCLEIEPDRRYNSASALADDLGRHLKGELIRTE